MSSPMPMVTIAMPAFNEERFIETCIRSVWEQDYPRERIEILVADGRSTDRTREILEDLARQDPRIRMIDNPERLQAAGLGHIVKQARGDIIVRMDVHCEYATDYVRKCVATLDATGADNVGGAQRAKAKTSFQEALCAALGSPLGVGGAAYRSATAEGFVDTVFLGAFRRAVFERVGLWDPAAATNEDAELNQRILETGGKIYLSRDIVVHYFPRDSFRTLAKQYFRYGQGRARTLLKRGAFPKLRPLIPFFLVSGAAAMLLLPPAWPLLPPAVAGYLLASGAEAVRVAAPLGPRAVATAMAIFPILHFSHGSGFAAGLWRYLRQPDWPAEPELLPPRAHLRAV
ncbi:MAG: glycosyltransferase family 2 protein [Myxococcales bacterium]|nr:glycosyltransferase family 2 protein [Myxococcales bacterium]